MQPIVALVGRPNVGKSTLFNRLIQRRVAIIEDLPGVTRDRVYADTEWTGRSFTVVDTGGLRLEETGELETQVTRQARVAIAEADVIVLVVDVRTEPTTADQQAADLLRRTRKPVIVCANKSDNPAQAQTAVDYYRLGLGEVVPVSAIHGLGTGDLLDAVVASLPPAEPEEDGEQGLIKVAVVGRPNVGKSTLVNALLGEERMVVSGIAGTTTDAVDVLAERDGLRLLLIDTAGLRRKARVDTPLERHSVLRALRAIGRADVVLLVMDAVEGLTDQELKIAGYSKEQGKACIVVVNKWDLVEKTNNTMRDYTAAIRRLLKFMDYIEVAFVSAKSGARLTRLLPVVKLAWENHGRRVGTGPLNACIHEAVALTPPPADRRRRLKVFYATQLHVRPPGMVLVVNDKELAHFSYMRYLENRIRETFDFRGTPIRLHLRERSGRGDRPRRAVRRHLPRPSQQQT